jgi:pyroglutamyl-peptidase
MKRRREKRSRKKRPKVLVTGFGPFPGVVKNPSAQLARALARSHRAKRVARVSALIIPTTYNDAAKLPRQVAHRRPDAVLMFGLAGRARVLRIETRGRNRTNSKYPDAARKKAPHVLAPGAPKVLKITASTAALLQATRVSGVRVRLSNDAGGYVCNAAIFHLLNATRGVHAPLIAFVHIPWPREQVSGKKSRPLFSAIQRAAEAMLVALAKHSA